MNKIDVYDFDGTIYNGDSSIDFFLYAIKKKKSIIKYLPKIFTIMILKCLGLVSTKSFKETFFSFIKEIENLEEYVKEFWKMKREKINKFFLDNISENRKTYVISASPEFLLRPYLSEFKNIKLIATKVDRNGKINEENCKGQKKVELLKKAEQDFEIENFYTDSSSDLPLVKLSKNSYYIKKGRVKKWNLIRKN